MRIVRIILIITFSVMFVTSLFVFIPALHHLHLEEMAAQIEKFGFYKKDFWISVERYRKNVAYALGLCSGTIIGASGAIITCFCQMVSDD